jgi:heparinase II/III-like protein
VTRLLRRLRSRLASFAGDALRSLTVSGEPFDLQLRRARTTFEDWLEGSGGRLYAHLDAESASHLKNRHGDIAAATLAAAGEVLAHRFDLLGSGPFVYVDAERPARAGGYRPIDWYRDPVRGLRFPQGIRHSDWNLQTMRPGNADIKYPWELARCQHWPLLGQAWRLSGEAAYAREIADELDDFMAANPVGFGINWTCTMDVALRALNWAIGLQLVRDCPALDAALWRRAYGHLHDHGVFIFANLENKYEVTSNHFLSNVVGLYYLAAVFSGLGDASSWNEFCRDALEREIQVQVLDDGADFESSVPYHRLVVELFLGAARLADWRSEPLSSAYRAKLRQMVEFLAAVLRPDGLMPQIGDADDGRLHIFSAYGRWQPQDPRHIFAPAALALGEPRWLEHCGPCGAWEAAWWGFSVRGVTFRDGPVPDGAALHANAGLAVARKGGTYLAITNGIVGTKGFGNHKHNDQLGFEFHADGRALLVDPGSFVYTGDPDARNLFRGTAYHNSVMVDGAEQNELRPEWLFRLIECARPEHLSFEADERCIKYRGRHVGYTRLAPPVVHEREFEASLDAPGLRILDRFHGSGPHELSWHFHLAPGVATTLESESRAILEAAGKRYAIDAPTGLKASIQPAWYSPSYGVRMRCAAVQWTGRFQLDGERGFEFSIRSASQMQPAAT